jgi:hypothetical protein
VPSLLTSVGVVSCGVGATCAVGVGSVLDAMGTTTLALGMGASEAVDERLQAAAKSVAAAKNTVLCMFDAHFTETIGQLTVGPFGSSTLAAAAVSRSITVSKSALS